MSSVAHVESRQLQDDVFFEPRPKRTCGYCKAGISLRTDVSCAQSQAFVNV